MTDESKVPTTSGAALRLHLSALRSAHLIGNALAAEYPEESEWLEFLGDEACAEAFEGFAAFINEVRGMVDTGAVVDLKQLESIGATHLDHGLEAVDALAARLSVESKDLLVTLLYG